MSDCKTVPYLVIDAFCRCDHFVCYSFHFRFTEQPLKVPEEVLDELVYTVFTICASSFLFYFPYLYSLITFFLRIDKMLKGEISNLIETKTA